MAGNTRSVLRCESSSLFLFLSPLGLSSSFIIIILLLLL